MQIRLHYLPRFFRLGVRISSHSTIENNSQTCRIYFLIGWNYWATAIVLYSTRYNCHSQHQGY